MIDRWVVSACIVYLVFAGCGGDSNDDSDGPATEPKAGAGTTPSTPPPAGDASVRDPKNDPTGPESTGRDVDVRSVFLRRKGDALIVKLLFWQTAQRDMSVRMEFEKAGQRSEVRLIRTGGGSLAIREEGSGGDLRGGRISAKGPTMRARMPLDAVTSERVFGFRAVAKSFDGRSVDPAPDKHVEFP